MIVIASIHQPSTDTLLLFDNILLLSEGKSLYYGPPNDSVRYFQSLGVPPPPMVSPAEFMLDLANTDFRSDSQHISRLNSLFQKWDQSQENRLLESGIEAAQNRERLVTVSATKQRRSRFAPSLPWASLILLHRMALV